MRLNKVEIIKFRNFKNIVIDFEKNNYSSLYSIASINGGGKSTLLQFIFILLHCFMDKNRKKYINYLLNNIPHVLDYETVELVKFVIEDNDQLFNLSFSIVNSTENDFGGNFDLYLDVEDTRINIDKQRRNAQEFDRVITLHNEIRHSERVTPSMRRNMQFIKPFISGEREKDSFDRAFVTNDIRTLNKVLESIIERNSHLHQSVNDLQNIYENLKSDFEDFDSYLQQVNTKYITHINNDNALILDTDASSELLQSLSNKVYLTAPISQIFLFLSNEDKDSIFHEFSSSDELFSNSYFDCVRRAKTDLSGFYTYDFASTELILESFKKASEEDLKLKRKSGEYGTMYDQLTNELKDFLDGKEISENEEGNKVIFKLKNNNEYISPEDLSHGELKKLGIYIWLKYIVEENSIILMDEVDIALHPKWQYELVNNFTRWAKESQYLLATHSPQILSSTYYKNLIKLENGGVIRYQKPPLDRDINSIITQIMEAPDFPEELLNLHKEYRKLINDGKIKSKEAKNLKEKILEYESEDSSFFQEINFELELI